MWKKVSDLMYSPPFIPPLYFVKRGKLLNMSKIKPPLCTAERGFGGEFMKDIFIPLLPLRYKLL
jgi:hypothetical protein